MATYVRILGKNLSWGGCQEDHIISLKMTTVTSKK